MAGNVQKNAWFEGVIVMNDGDVKVGSVSYATDYDMIAIQDGEKKLYFNAHQVAKFTFYDHEKNQIRNFEAKALRVNDQIRGRSFYEIIIKGEYSLLRKRMPYNYHLTDERYEDVSNSLAGISRSDYEEAMSYSYFISFEDQIVPMVKFRSKILPNMKKSLGQDLKEFMKHKRIRLDNDAHKILLVKYYNKTSTETAVSRHSF